MCERVPKHYIFIKCGNFSDFTDEAFRHRFCRTGPSSWCQWQIDKCCGTSKYKKNVKLPNWIHVLLKPIFTDLSNDILLSKCLHGKTKNANEAINQIIWQKCQKNVFVSRPVLEMCINSAIIQFNNGANGVKKVLHCFNINTGIHTGVSKQCHFFSKSHHYE